MGANVRSKENGRPGRLKRAMAVAFDVKRGRQVGVLVVQNMGVTARVQRLKGRPTVPLQDCVSLFKFKLGENGGERQMVERFGPYRHPLRILFMTWHDSIGPASTAVSERRIERWASQNVSSPHR